MEEKAGKVGVASWEQKGGVHSAWDMAPESGRILFSASTSFPDI